MLIILLRNVVHLTRNLFYHVEETDIKKYGGRCWRYEHQWNDVAIFKLALLSGKVDLNLLNAQKRTIDSPPMVLLPKTFLLSNQEKHLSRLENQDDMLRFLQGRKQQYRESSHKIFELDTSLTKHHVFHTGFAVYNSFGNREELFFTAFNDSSEMSLNYIHKIDSPNMIYINVDNKVWLAPNNNDVPHDIEKVFDIDLLIRKNYVPIDNFPRTLEDGTFISGTIGLSSILLGNNHVVRRLNQWVRYSNFDVPIHEDEVSVILGSPRDL